MPIVEGPVLLVDARLAHVVAPALAKVQQIADAEGERLPDVWLAFVEDVFLLASAHRATLPDPVVPSNYRQTRKSDPALAWLEANHPELAGEFPSPEPARRRGEVRLSEMDADRLMAPAIEHPAKPENPCGECLTRAIKYKRLKLCPACYQKLQRRKGK